MKRTRQQQIDAVMKDFNFNKIYITMKKLNWKWGRPLRQPSVRTLKKTARYLLENAVRDRREVATGGFHAKYDGFTLNLEFVVEWSHSFKEEIL